MGDNKLSTVTGYWKQTAEGIDRFDLKGTYSVMTMTLSDIPIEEQLLTISDGNIDLDFEYTEDLDTYEGINIPILIGADTTETQVNTIMAYNEYEGTKPDITVTSNEAVLIVTSNIMGSEGIIDIDAPTTVGTASELFVGKDEISLRNLITELKNSIPAGTNKIGSVDAQITGSDVDLASESKQDEAKAVLDLLNAKDYATEAKLEAVRALLAGTINTQLTGSRKALRVVSINQITTVNAGGGETLDIYASAGNIGKVINLSVAVSPPPGASTGTHDFLLRNDTVLASIAQGVSNFGDSVEWAFSGWNVATSIKRPSDANQALNAVKGITMSATIPLRITYNNNTNAAQTNARSGRVILLEEAVI